MKPDCVYVMELYLSLDLNLGNPALMFFPFFLSLILLKNGKETQKGTETALKEEERICKME